MSERSVRGTRIYAVSSRLVTPSSFGGWLSRSKCALRLSRLRLRFRRIPSKPRDCASARPTGSRSRAHTSALRGGRTQPRTRTSASPTGSRSRAPTSAPRAGRSRGAHVHSLQKQPFSRAHFSVSRWPPFAARAHVRLSHGQPFSRAHFRASRWPPSAAYSHVASFHGQPFSRAHFSTSRWPPFAAFVHVLLVPRAVVLARPLEHLQVAAQRRQRARRLVPRAVVLARPLQRLEVAALRRVRARQRVPRAAVLARPHQHLEVAALRRPRARRPVPRAAVLARPLQRLFARGGRPSPRSCTSSHPTGNSSARRSAFNASRSPPAQRQRRGNARQTVDLVGADT